jgi:hypothetical protein
MEARVESELHAWAAGVVDSRGSFIFYRKAVELRLQVALRGDREIGDRLVAILGGNVYGPYERAGRDRKVYLYMLRGERSVGEAAELMWPWLGDCKRRQFSLRRQGFLHEINAKNRLAKSQASYGIEHV